MPSRKTLGEQLEDALRGVSQKELARRLAAADGKAHDAKAVESKRRWLLKLLKDEVKRPHMGDIETALNLPAGHFVLPTPEERERRRVHLEELEERVAELESALNGLEQSLEGLAVLPDRVTALEQRDRPRKRKSG